MYCTACGGYIDEGALYCPKCGAFLGKEEPKAAEQVLFRLTGTENRNYEIAVSESSFTIDGDFMYLRDRDIYAAKTKWDTARLKDFMGMGYLSKRSYRKTLIFVFGGSALELLKQIIDKISDWADKANDYLQYVDKSVSTPDWMSYVLNIAAGICILFGVVLFFSKKKVIEISFLDKRFCVPQNSMTMQEYNMLYSSIKEAGARK